MTRFVPINNAPANKWPPEQETLLRKHYATMPIPELMELLGKTKSAIYGKAYNLGIVREAEVVRHDGQKFTIGQPRVTVSKRHVQTAVREAPVLNSTVNHKEHPYTGAELLPYQGRPGAMDAYYLPSLSANKRMYRDGRVEAA